MRKAITDYNMIEAGEHIVVGLSGGKDSLLLTAALNEFRKFTDKPFTLTAVTVDLGFKDSDLQQLDSLVKYCESLGVPHVIEKTDIAEIIFDIRKEKNPCSLCSKMRRGCLNNAVKSLGSNKLAYGHHADDVLETMLLSLFYEARFSTFQPKSFMDRTGVTLIRPFIYIEEHEIVSMVKKLDLPVFFNCCPANKHTQRENMKNLVKTLSGEIPYAKDQMLSAIFHPERNNLWDKM
jgi:tRNA(Ile)-lysidine synthetase-like protein